MENRAAARKISAIAHPSRVGVSTLAALFLLGPAIANPGDLSGSALIAGTSTDSSGVTSDLLEERYTFSLLQELTPYLGLRADYAYLDLNTRLQGGAEFGRLSRQPRLELLYNRPELSGRLSVLSQSIETTGLSDSFDRRSLAASLAWRPSRGPSLSLNYRDDRNVADVSVLGSGVETRLFEGTAAYGRRGWGASYSFEQLVVDNRSNFLHTEQRRHELRGDATPSFLEGRLSLALSGRISDINRSAEIGEDAEIAEPLPSLAGLFVVDTSPELGELEPVPSLIDGDIRTPASPPIDVGGANTFRNVGTDLGVTRPASRLEVAVNTLSGPALVWRVFHSRDNLIWEELAGVTSRFDEALLRYVVRFPETEDRFFKAVNVSVNQRTGVLVTEIRALLDLDPSEVADVALRETDRYRADAVGGFGPFGRVTGSLGAGLSNDQALTAGLVRRAFSETHAFARLGVDLGHAWDLNLGWRFNDSENLAPPVLFRTVRQLTAGLDWVPRDTIEAVLVFGDRDESDRGTPLQSVQSVRLGLLTDLLPDLRLVSDLSRSRLSDPFAGRDRVTWAWSEMLEAQPTPDWTVSAGFVRTSNQSVTGEAVLDRTQYRLATTWIPSAYLSLTASWWVTDDAGRRSVNQSYAVSYAPGDRLTVTGSYQGFEGWEGRGTFTDSLSVNYQLFARFLLFASVSRSSTEGIDGESADIATFHTGLRASF